MQLDPEVTRIGLPTEHTNPRDGQVTWSPAKSLWYSATGLIGIIGGYFTFSIEAILVFLISTATTLCLGHSLGMHRRLIHNSYQCPLWLEYCFVHFGTLVGLAGPLGMTRAHDFRDWAQRQPHSHDFFAHRQHFIKDAWWQLHCDITLDHPPAFMPEKRLANNKVYYWMEKTWMAQQLPWALLFFAIGGISWVIWGICLRVAVSITGHWLIGYFAHNQGGQTWHIKGASAQGYNIPWAGLITMGECWHNNHHAFPGSAKIGLHAKQVDPGWWVLIMLEKAGLVWGIRLPEDLEHRSQVIPCKPVSKSLEKASPT